VSSYRRSSHRKRRSRAGCGRQNWRRSWYPRSLFARAPERLSEGSRTAGCCAHLLFNQMGDIWLQPGGGWASASYDAADYCLVDGDKDYGDTSYGASFDGRKPARDLLFRWLPAPVRAHRHLCRPFYSPACQNETGRRDRSYRSSLLARWFAGCRRIYDTPKVEVVSGSDLAHVFSPDTSDIQNGC